MPSDDTWPWELLRSLDDPDHLERPPSYQHGQSKAQFERLTHRLDTDFGCRCTADRAVQDASLHGRIDIPAAATMTRHPITVSISNFGGLAVVSVDNPGVWTDAEAAALLHPHDASRLHHALTDLDYTPIPEEPLWRPYDGSYGPASSSLPNTTWWTRYFDYL